MKVEFQHVGYTPGKHKIGKRDRFCLQDISFEIREGCMTALVGKNGAGKTTLFRLLLDRTAQYTGHILADGKEWREARVPFLGRIGYVSDEQKFFMEKTAMENAGMLQYFYESFSMERFCTCMETFGTPGQRALKDMSRGEYIKYQMAFAIAHESELYLLDEATAGMDPVFKKDFFKILHGLLAEENRTVLMSTHIQEDIKRHMDHEILLEAGRIVAEHEVEG